MHFPNIFTSDSYKRHIFVSKYSNYNDLSLNNYRPNKINPFILGGAVLPNQLRGRDKERKNIEAKLNDSIPIF